MIPCTIHIIMIMNSMIILYCLSHAVYRLFGISTSSTSLSDRVIVELRNITTTFNNTNETVIDSITIRDSSRDETGDTMLIAYRPSFSDEHNSNLGVLFFNLPGIFTCLQHVPYILHLPCFRTTAEEDGFLRGKAILQAGDTGNHFSIFSGGDSMNERTLTYGLAVQGCPQLNRTCLPPVFQTQVVCLLPRKYCG